MITADRGFIPAGLKYRSQVTIKNTCEFAVSSHVVRISLFRTFFTLYSLFIFTNPMMASYSLALLVLVMV